MRSVNMMELSQATIDRIEQEQTRYPNPRGALIEALHLARTEAGTLSMDVLTQIAGRFNMRPAEVAEVASFYSLLTLPPARAVLQVCTGLPCCLRGARSVVQELERKLGIRAGSATSDGGFAIVEVECLGSCATAPVMQVNLNSYLENVTPQSAASLCDSPDTANAARWPTPIISCAPRGVDAYLLPPDGERCNSLDAYQRRAGYQAVLDAARMKPADLRKLVEESGLRGRGGAGFVTGRKWAFMPPKDGGERYLAINSDESEPGTFKDRQILERNPHLLLEGILIAGHAIEADAAYIYVRGEYADAYANLRAAIAEAYRAGILGERALGVNRRFHVHAQRGAGAYICGEETGMLESMEGKKGQPRKRPPFPAQRGLWQRPTTVDNCETCAQVPAIILNGVDWYKARGMPNSFGNTLFGISGHVKRPGIYELPLGVKMRDLIYKYGGGLEEGRTVKAVIPGGISMPVLRGDQIDVPVDHESLKTVNTLLGTAGAIVLDDRSCMVRAALVIARFFEHESCGQCTQCREGTGWTYRTLKRIEAGEGRPEDLETLADTFNFMDGKCICALADGASWAARAFLKQFRADYEAHVSARKCPFPESFAV